MFPFRNKTSFYGEDLLEPRPNPTWKTSSFRLSATALSIYSKLSSILEAVFQPQPEDAPCHGDRDPFIMEVYLSRHKKSAVSAAGIL